MSLRFVSTEDAGNLRYAYNRTLRISDSLKVNLCTTSGDRQHFVGHCVRCTATNINDYNHVSDFETKFEIVLRLKGEGSGNTLGFEDKIALRDACFLCSIRHWET